MGAITDSRVYGRFPSIVPEMQTSDTLYEKPLCSKWDPLSSYIAQHYLGKSASPYEAEHFLKGLLHENVKKSYDLPDGVGGATEIKCDENGCHPYNPIVNGNDPEWLQKYSASHEEKHCEALKDYPYLIYGFVERYGEELGMLMHEGLIDYLNSLELKETDPKIAKAGRNISAYSPFINIYEDMARDYDLNELMGYYNEIGKSYAEKMFSENPYAIEASDNPVYPIAPPGGCGCSKAAACC